MSKPIRWGFLGTSFISNVMADAIIEEGTMQLHSVAGRSVEALKHFATKHCIENIFTDFYALIADNEVDVIYVALPNHIHHHFVVAAAEAGKAVLCEKSLSTDMTKTDEMLVAVKKNNVFFLEGLMYLAHPTVSKLMDIIERGYIGEIRCIRGQYCADISAFVNPKGKGALYNLGCYPVSLMHLVMQKMCGDEIFNQVNVTAKGRRGKDDNICESTAIFEFSNAIQCHMHTAEDYGLYSNFAVLGSKGSLEMLSNPWLPEASGNQLRLTKYEQSSQIIEVEAQGNAYLYQVKLVKRCIEKGAVEVLRPAARLSDSRAVMQLLTDWEIAASYTNS